MNGADKLQLDKSLNATCKGKACSFYAIAEPHQWIALLN